MYSQRLPGAERTWSLKTGKEAPPALTQAMHAIAIAKSMGAEQHAADTLRKAENDLHNAEAFFNSKTNEKQIQTVARNATQLAEDARLISVKRTEQARLEAERQAAADRVAAAQTAAEREARQRELADSERRLAQEREQAARMRADQEERQRALAVQARIAAEAAAQQARDRAEQERVAALSRQQQLTAEQDRLRAEQQRLQTEAERARAEAQRLEQARLQAESDRQRMRDQLREQLNAVLVTRETARGLIVNMSDVLFDTARHSLRPAAREKLARVSGILSLHSDLVLEVEGHTDSVGSDSYNQGLSERRAESVKQYLISQGVKSESITSRGFGESQPVADNSTAAGRQQNRRVEIVVSGESIRSTTESSVSSRTTPER
jgi:outer membrane protein OmpA-like peptidoglycan-associated protein